MQHALTDYVVYDELSRSLTRNTYAAQVGKGVHFGLKMLGSTRGPTFSARRGADEAARRAAGLHARWRVGLRRGHGHQGRHPALLPKHRPRPPQGGAGKALQDRRILELMFRYIDEVSDGLGP